MPFARACRFCANCKTQCINFARLFEPTGNRDFCFHVNVGNGEVSRSSDALRKQEHTDSDRNTVVIITSDHGDHLGDHGEPFGLDWFGKFGILTDAWDSGGLRATASCRVCAGCWSPAPRPLMAQLSPTCDRQTCRLHCCPSLHRPDSIDINHVCSLPGRPHPISGGPNPVLGNPLCTSH